MDHLLTLLVAGAALGAALAGASTDTPCGAEGLEPCLKAKAVELLDKAIAVPGPLPLTSYLSLVPTGAAPAAPDPVPDQDIDQALADRVARLIETRTIHLTIPGSDIIEGRKKKSKGMGMLLMAALAMKGMMLQMAMAKIAMIAGKALMIGKMALLLSAIVGLKKLVGGGGHNEHAQVVYASEGHGGGWSRSGEGWRGEGRAGQSRAGGAALAYRAQARALPLDR